MSTTRNTLDTFVKQGGNLGQIRDSYYNDSRSGYEPSVSRFEPAPGQSEQARMAQRAETQMKNGQVSKPTSSSRSTYRP